MALRISKQEKKWLYSHNASARAKKTRLKETYNVNAKFKVKKPSEFTSRAELNIYKQNLKVFLLRGTHAYVKGGIVSRYFSEKGLEVPFAIPKDEYLQIKRIIAKRNAYNRRQAQVFKQVKVSVKGKKQQTRLATIIHSAYVPQGRLVYDYSSYKPIHFKTEYITSAGTWKKFSYAIKKYQSAKSLKKKQKQMQTNYAQALRNMFGNLANPLSDLILSLSVDEFMAYYESEEFSDFTYIYDEVEMMNVLSYMTTHLVNFVEQVNPDKVTLKQAQEAKEYLEGLNVFAIPEEYKKGSRGGVRVDIDSNHYIDLTKEEEIPYLIGAITMDMLRNNPEYQDRIHYKKARRNYAREKTDIKDLL